jgi:hypothetical protein
MMIQPSLKYTRKFYAGVGLVLFSLLLGKITTATFIFYFSHPVIRWSSVIIYFLSWPMLILGAWWVGSEYYARIKRYVSYRFYHESVKRGTKRIYQKTKDGYHKTKSKTKTLHQKIRGTLEKRRKSL